MKKKYIVYRVVGSIFLKKYSVYLSLIEIKSGNSMVYFILEITW